MGFGSRIQPDIVKDARQTPIILILKVISVGVFVNHNGNRVPAASDIRCDIVFGRFLTAFIVAKLAPVNPYKGSRSGFFHSQKDLPVFPG